MPSSVVEQAEVERLRKARDEHESAARFHAEEALMPETQKQIVRLPSQEFMRALEWYYRPRQTFTEWLEANQPKAKSG